MLQRRQVAFSHRLGDPSQLLGRAAAAREPQYKTLRRLLARYCSSDKTRASQRTARPRKSSQGRGTTPWALAGGAAAEAALEEVLA